LKIQGIVSVQITVSATGAVTSAKVVDGHPLLREAALVAAKRRRYKAYEVNGKPTPFTTVAEVPFSLGVPNDVDKKQEQLAKQYFAESDRCRDLLKGQKWQEAEPVCKAVVSIADQLAEHRVLEKMGAYEEMGHALLGLKRHQEALDYFSRAFEIGKTVLKETDPETGIAYRNLGVANHMLGKLDKAREFYGKAEKILRHAYAHIDLDEARQSYIDSLKVILRYHAIAAEQSGAAKEAEEIRKRLTQLPQR
jgi:TonB family protein